MRVLGFLLLFLLIFGLVMFAFFNAGVKVTVTTPWNTPFPDTELFKVVLLSVLVGVVATGIYALAEGAQARLSNRRLRREIRRLETEMNYLRTQPPASPAPDHRSLESTPLAAVPQAEGQFPEPPSAPVYGPDDERPSEGDDDTYSGGRAV